MLTSNNLFAMLKLRKFLLVPDCSYVKQVKIAFPHTQIRRL